MRPKASLMNTRADQHATARRKLSLCQPQLQSAVAFHRAEQFTGHARIVQPNRHRVLPVHLTKNTYRPRTARAVAIDAQHAIADLCRKRALRQQPEGIAFAGLHRGTLQPGISQGHFVEAAGVPSEAADTIGVVALICRRTTEYPVYLHVHVTLQQQVCRCCRAAAGGNCTTLERCFDCPADPAPAEQ